MWVKRSRPPAYLVVAVAMAACFFVSAAPLAGAADANAAPRASAGAGAKNVILISWDGVDRSVLKELLDANRLPNLAAIIREGSIHQIEVVGHQTETKPSHAEMLTGLGPETTGVYTNSNFRAIPEGLTIFERVQKQLGKGAVRTIFVAAKIGNLGGRGPDIPATGNAPRVRQSEPYFLTKRHLDVFDTDDREANEVCDVALKHLADFKAPRFLAFVHFRDADRAGHAKGSGSAEYRRGAVACDEALGRIVDWLKSEKLHDRTLLYVTADHGFDHNAKGHSNAPHIWLATNDKGVTKGGTIADIPATILERFGVDTSKLKPKLIGKPLLAPTPASRPAATPKAVPAIPAAA